MRKFLGAVFIVVTIIFLYFLINSKGHVFVFGKQINVKHNGVECSNFCIVNEDELIEISAPEKDGFVHKSKALSLFFNSEEDSFLMGKHNLFIFGNYYEADIVFEKEVVRLKPGESYKADYRFIKLEKGLYPDVEIKLSTSNSEVASLEDDIIIAKTPGFSCIEARVDGVSSALYVIVEGENDEFVGKVSAVSKFSLEQFLDEMNFGHSFLMFESYQDGITIELNDYFLSYLPSEEFYNIALNNPEKLLYSNVDEEDMKSYADSLVVPAKNLESITLNRGGIATFGQTSISDSLKVSIDSIINSNIFERYDFHKLITIDFRSFLYNFSRIIVSYIKDGLNNQLANNGVTDYGGHSLNYELHRQAEYMSFTPNRVLSIDVTSSELDALVYFINNYGGYATATENCASMAMKGFNIVTSAFPKLRIKDQFIDSPAYLMYKFEKLKYVKIKERNYSYQENVEIFKPANSEAILNGG